MRDFITFLNANGGALNLIFAAVVAAATVVYAWLTAKLVGETRRLRQVETEPHIEVFYRPRDEWINFVDIVVKNIGSGPAYDLKFSYDATTSTKGAEGLLARLKELEAFSSGIAYLGPGEEFFSFWTQMTEDFEDKIATQIRARTSCQGATGSTYDRAHLLDLSELKGIHRLGEPPLLMIAQKLDALQKDVHQFVTGFNKPVVNVLTHEDRERERKEWEERRAAARKQQGEADAAC